MTLRLIKVLTLTSGHWLLSDKIHVYGAIKFFSVDDLILQEDVIQMLPMVNEADAMSAELDKKVKFELALVSPQARGLKEGKTEVQQCSLLFCGIFAITRLSIVRSNSKGFNQCCCQHYCPISSL